MRTVCVEEPLEGWKAWRWAGRTRGVWRDIFRFADFGTLEVDYLGPAVVVSLGLIGSVVDVQRLISCPWLSSVAGRATRVHVISLHSRPPAGLGSIRQLADV
jgi:hypothetical protein